MSITIERINDHVVKRIPIKFETKPVIGADVCSECYCNMFLVASTNSGKTTVTNHLMKECVGKNTVIIAFVSTLYNDPNWLEIMKYFKKKGIAFEGHTSIIEDGVNHLE